MVTDGFAVSFEQYMTSKRQVICAFIDARGTSNKGTSMLYSVYRNLGSHEMDDQINVTRLVFNRYKSCFKQYNFLFIFTGVYRRCIHGSIAREREYGVEVMVDTQLQQS